MKLQLRVLYIDRREDEAELVLGVLRRGGYEVSCVRVETEAELLAQLEREGWDAILSDWELPGFSAAQALEALRHKDLDLPFVVVSSQAGEEVAVAAMRAGAHDCLMRDRPERLLGVIDRELREARMRRERREMQSQLILSERLSSMGLLAAGVAHEINNPLASVIANLQFATRSLDELGAEERERAAWFTETREALADALEAAGRVRQIACDIKVFSRTRDDAPKGPVDVHAVIDSSVRMAWTEIRHRARLTRQFGQVPFVLGSEARLGQVFLNLLVNAAQAIAEGQADRNEIRVTTRPGPNREVLVDLADTGSGMSVEVMAQIFTPFFTTKPRGVGTGLGLAICDQIVGELGGRLWVESTPGQGSIFHLALPTAEGEESQGELPPPPHAPARAGRILVIDDEPQIARAMKRILPEHDLVDVTAAEKALALIRGGARFDLIFCDVMMPQMTGMDLHAELCRIAPDQAGRVAFLTGGAFTERARAFLDSVPNPRVAKPFDAQDLRSVIETALARPAGQA